MVFIVELHYGRGHGNTALLFDFHPVGSGEFAAFFAFYRTRALNRAGEQQQFFGERGFTRVGVGNNGESAAAAHLF